MWGQTRAGQANGHDVSVQHHERQSPIAFPGMLLVEADDRLLLPRRELEITGNPTVVFIDAPIAFSPVVELAGPHAQPVDESCSAIISASTSSLVWIFFSRNSIRCCSAWWSGRLLPWKAAAPFSKNSFCQRQN